MGTAGWIILIVVIVVLAAAAAYALMGNRRTEAKREQATELRQEAAQSTAAVEASHREAEEAAARAEVARAEAARAEQDAAQAQEGLQVEEARVEDRVRAADSVDPDVDTKAEDYRPSEPTTAPETGGGTTYADPDDPTVTDATGRPLDESATDADDPVHTHQYRYRNDPT
jgi:FtsZ-interacting cell division protein ZipA